MSDETPATRAPIPFAKLIGVKLVEIAPLAGAMRFEMLSEPRPLPMATRSFHKAKGQTRRLQSKAPRRAQSGRTRSK